MLRRHQRQERSLHQLEEIHERRVRFHSSVQSVVRNTGRSNDRVLYSSWVRCTRDLKVSTGSMLSFIEHTCSVNDTVTHCARNSCLKSYITVPSTGIKLTKSSQFSNDISCQLPLLLQQLEFSLEGTDITNNGGQIKIVQRKRREARQILCDERRNTGAKFMTACDNIRNICCFLIGTLALFIPGNYVRVMTRVM